VHPPRFGEFSHGSVDQREAGHTCTPDLKKFQIEGPDTLPVVGFEFGADRLGMMEHDISEEVAPRQLAEQRFGARLVQVRHGEAARAEDSPFQRLGHMRAPR
jgi:hypothetical protein